MRNVQKTYKRLQKQAVNCEQTAKGKIGRKEAQKAAECVIEQKKDTKRVWDGRRVLERVA